MIGLKRRLTYDELIDQLDVDPIKKYPDRRATQIENSHYMSQLASGLQEVIEQNDRVVKEKTKSLLLQDLASSSHMSHRQLQSVSGGSRGQHDESFDSAISETRSYYKYLSTARGEHIGLQQQILEQQQEIIGGERERQHQSAQNVAQPLIQRQEQLERHYQDQLAIQN